MKHIGNFLSPIERIEKKDFVINRDYEDFLHEIGFDSFESIWRNQSGEIIKQIKPRSVIRLRLKQNNTIRVLYLKRHNPEFIGLRGLFNLLFRGKRVSEGLLEFDNICEFRKKNLQTAIPIAAGEKIHQFFWIKSFLITEDYYPYISLEAIIRNNPQFFTAPGGKARKTTLINEISILAKKMHQSGFNHQDFNATHILLHYENKSEAPEIALFDLQRVEKNRFFRLRWKIKSLARLNYTLPDELFTQQDRKNLLLFYKGKTRLGFRDRLEWFWIRMKTARIKRHTEKKPIIVIN